MTENKGRILFVNSPDILDDIYTEDLTNKGYEIIADNYILESTREQPFDAALIFAGAPIDSVNRLVRQTLQNIRKSNPNSPLFLLHSHPDRHTYDSVCVDLAQSVQLIKSEHQDGLADLVEKRIAESKEAK